MSLLYHIKYTEKKIPQEIIERINELHITDKSFAAFDLDNTLLIGDIGEAVFALLVKKKFIKNFGWKDYLSQMKKNKLKAYKHIIDIMQGLQLGILEKVTLEVLNKKAAISIEGYKIPIPKRSEMMKLILEMLAEKGMPTYVITASNEVSAAIICKKYFEIPASHIIGAEVSIDKKGIIQVGAKEFPYAKGKVNILKKRFKNKPLVTGGDSPGDKYLINYTAQGGIQLWAGKAAENI